MKKLIFTTLLSIAPLVMAVTTKEVPVANKENADSVNNINRGQLDNVEFNNLKLLYKLSDLNWFIKKHAISDVQKGGGETAIIDNPTFDTLKLLYELSDLNWFIEKSAIRDAKEAGSKKALAVAQALGADLTRLAATLKEEQAADGTASEETLAAIRAAFQKHIAQLRQVVCA